MTIQQKQQIVIFMMGDIIRFGILYLSFLFINQYYIHCPNYSYYCDEHSKDDGYEVGCLAAQNDYTSSEVRCQLWHGTEFVVYTKYYDEKDDIPDSLRYANGSKVSKNCLFHIRTPDDNFYKPCIVLGLILLTIFIFIRFIYDIFYIIRLCSDYRFCRFLERLDTFRIFISILTVMFEGLGITFCSLLYLSKFDKEGSKRITSLSSWNVDNTSRALIITASVFLPLQIIILVCQKIVKICNDEDYPYVYNILFPLFTVLNIILSLISSGQCFTSNDAPYIYFLILILFRSASYIYELLFIYCGLIRHNKIGISNNTAYIQNSISKSEARVRKRKINMEHNITNLRNQIEELTKKLPEETKKENDKFKEFERKEVLYQNRHMEQITKIEGDERERIRIIEEKEREKIRSKEAKKQAEIDLRIRLENERLLGIRLERERVEKDRIERAEMRVNLEKENKRIREEKYKLEEERAAINVEQRNISTAKAKLRENEEAVMEYRCPITLGIMEDPVVAADGRTYERVAISEWLETHGTSPATGLPLTSTNLIPNLQLRNLIVVHNLKIKENE